MSNYHYATVFNINNNPVPLHRCSICYRYYESMLDRVYRRSGVPYHFNHICLLCNDILQKAFMSNIPTHMHQYTR